MSITRRQKREAQQQRADMQEALTHPAVRRIFAWMLDRGGLLAANPQASLAHEGRRAMALELVTAMQAVDPLALPKILAEEITRQQRDAADTEEVEIDNDA